ncbi:MAG: hypothetical protein M3Z84_01225 [Actinomycetota bacterium]|nr:hypothetical protein [Actinomycetota bacterium]
MTGPTFTVVFEPVENGWIQARLAEIPAVISVGRDRAEALSMVEDALREYLLAVAGGEPTEVNGESEEVSLVLRPAG